ncbi:MAG: DUF222 domain-containing protein [Nitriliruptoraceae bacterium]
MKQPSTGAMGSPHPHPVSPSPSQAEPEPGARSATDLVDLDPVLSAVDRLTGPGLLPVVARAVDRLARTDLDGLSDAEADVLLAELRRPLTQLEGVRARVAAVQQRRRLAARGSGSIDATLAEHRNELGRQQRLPPGEAGRLLDAGRAAATGTLTGRAVQEGRFGVSQARTIARVLAPLVGPVRDDVEAELVELAGELDPVAFGRAARRILGRVEPEALAEQQRRQEPERRFRACDTEDGGFAFSGLLHGTAAETARVALQAFRRPDTPDERRTPEQRGADAFEQLCAAALAAGTAPTRHGVRPQVLVTIGADQLAALEAAPETVAGTFVGSGQPIAGPEVRHLVADSQLVRVVLDADAVPIEVSTVVRTVPAGLWRALLIRDRGCRWPGCDAPAAWCDVAHATRAFTDGGRLTLDNALLLCRRHHRRYDRSPHHAVIRGTEIRFPHLDPPPRQGVAPHGTTIPDAARHPPRQPTRTARPTGPRRRIVEEQADTGHTASARASPGGRAVQHPLVANG